MAAAGLAGVTDLESFSACSRSDTAAHSVAVDFRHGMDLRITGVPALVITNRLVVGSPDARRIVQWLDG